MGGRVIQKNLKHLGFRDCSAHAQRYNCTFQASLKQRSLNIEAAIQEHYLLTSHPHG